MKQFDIKIEPNVPFYHVSHKITYPTIVTPCADCASTGKTLAGNRCSYCNGKGSNTRQDIKNPKTGWLVECVEADRFVWLGGDEYFYESDSYYCGETETDTFYPNNCFLTEEEANTEAAARNLRDNNG